MRRYFSSMVIVVLLAAILGGCASVENIPFDREQADIRDITLLHGPLPEGYYLDVFDHPGYYFGAIGSVIGLVDMAEKAKSLEQAMDSNDAHTNLLQTLSKTVADRFADSPYSLTIEQAPNGEQYKFLEDYKNLDTSAVLDIRVVRIGFVAVSAIQPYRPALVVKARLVDRGIGKTLYQETFLWGEPKQFGMLKNVTMIKADERYSFSDIDALISQSDLAEVSLEEGMEKIAQSMSDHLLESHR